MLHFEFTGKNEALPHRVVALFLFIQNTYFDFKFSLWGFQFSGMLSLKILWIIFELNSKGYIAVWFRCGKLNFTKNKKTKTLLFLIIWSRIEHNKWRRKWSESIFLNHLGKWALRWKMTFSSRRKIREASDQSWWNLSLALNYGSSHEILNQIWNYTPVDSNFSKYFWISWVFFVTPFHSIFIITGYPKVLQCKYLRTQTLAV